MCQVLTLHLRAISLQSLPFDPSRKFRIGTRASLLALAQAHEVRARLMAAHDLPEDAFEIVDMTTTGDQIQSKALREFGGKGLFTKEVEEALLESAIDCAVHSMKDMPTELPPGLVIETVLPREDPRDAFVSLKYKALDEMPDGSVVGSSSLRRAAQISARYPDLKVINYRGNVQTRLRKLEDGVADATLLACAGLNRLRKEGHPAPDVPPIDIDVLLPAVSQGIIGIEHRQQDEDTAGFLNSLNHAETEYCMTVERAFLADLDGSCHTPIAGLATRDGDTINFKGEILSPDGKQVFRAERSGPQSQALAMGKDAAAEIKSNAGDNFFETLG